MGVTPVTQRRLPHTPWDDPVLARMPGMRPVDGLWIVVDEAYPGHMALRAHLMRERREDVVAVLPGAEAALAELFEVVVAALPEGFTRRGDGVLCPDGRLVGLDGAPFDVMAALVQEDLLLLERREDEHMLIAGLLCFPSLWTLSEKIGRPLARIHRPVPQYDAELGMRVQRLFDRAPAGRAMWRANAMGHDEAVLHRPLPEGAPHPAGPVRYVRSERQTVLRLPQSGAILFAIHTWIVALEDLTAEQRVGCPFG